MEKELRLMCVLAHPDDESLGTGGAPAKYAAEGVETYLVTAVASGRRIFSRACVRDCANDGLKSADAEWQYKAETLA